MLDKLFHSLYNYYPAPIGRVYVTVITVLCALHHCKFVP
jgi:hypothetical protein